MKPQTISLLKTAAFCTIFLAPVSYGQDSSLFIVKSIEIQRIKVFDTLDPHDNNFLGAFVNALHITTRDRVIRRELLLKD